jgi:hypothetical protein
MAASKTAVIVLALALAAASARAAPAPPLVVRYEAFAAGFPVADVAL